MTAGTIGKWLKAEGDKVTPGEAVAEIETDKASMAYEAQDEFFLAKIIAQKGTEVVVGSPIMITVDDSSSVSAFANYVAPSVSAPPTPAKPAPVSIPAPAPAPAPALAIPTPTPAINIPATVQVTTTRPVPQPSAASKPAELSAVFQASPLAAKLNKDRADYITRFGRTGHAAVVSKPQKK
jgi:pyruvate dehydrogenase E2 component (dihydrolipoamide acetyltransferase)